MKKFSWSLAFALSCLAGDAFANCNWNGNSYPEGTRAQDGQHVCSQGQWVAISGPSPQPSCFENQVSGSNLCRNGQWRNMSSCYLNLIRFACNVDEALGNCHWDSGLGCQVGPR